MEGEDCEMLKDSVVFSIGGCDDTLLEDCCRDMVRLVLKLWVMQQCLILRLLSMFLEVLV